MTKRRSNTKMAESLEKLAREYVNTWIEQGVPTYDMKDKAKMLREHFEAFMLRDVDTFARTGKYPEYVQPGE